MRNTGGQVLVEMMVALGVLIVALTAFLNLLNNSLSLNRVTADRYLATYLAAEGIEIVKDIQINSSQDVFSGHESGDAYEVQYNIQPVSGGVPPVCVSSPCSNNQMEPVANMSAARFLNYDEANHVYTYDAGTPTSFKRVVTLTTQPSTSIPDEVKVQSTVKWTTRGGGTFLLTLEDHFFNHH